MNQEILRTCKSFIDANDVPGLHAYYREMMATEFPQEPDWPWLFQKLYLHACLRGRQEISQWLHGALFPMLDPIQQIALRQTFPYGRYLLSRAPRNGTQNL
jgi:hypothetical protein